MHIDKDAIKTLSKILVKIGWQADKIRGINEDYQIDLSSLDIDIIDDVLDYIEVPEDNCTDEDIDDEDCFCRDGLVDGLIDCGSNETAITNFLLDVCEEFRH